MFATFAGSPFHLLTTLWLKKNFLESSLDLLFASFFLVTSEVIWHVCWREELFVIDLFLSCVWILSLMVVLHLHSPSPIQVYTLKWPDRELNLRALDRKSDVLTATPPSHRRYAREMQQSRNTNSLAAAAAAADARYALHHYTQAALCTAAAGGNANVDKINTSCVHRWWDGIRKFVWYFPSGVLIIMLCCAWKKTPTVLHK